MTQRRIPRWAALFNFTEYSLRIGTATAWVEAGGDAAELQHLGAWASQIGKEVYARMSVERALHLHDASLSSTGVTLDSLLNVTNTATASEGAAFVAGAAPPRSSVLPAALPAEPPVSIRKRAAPDAQQSLSKFLCSGDGGR